MAGLPPIAIVVRLLRLSRGFTQAHLARELLGKNDAGYLSRLESGAERPEIKKLSEIEYAFAKLGEPLDPFEVRMLEAAAIANWNWPSWGRALSRGAASSFRNSSRRHRTANAGLPGSAGTPVRACA